MCGVFVPEGPEDPGVSGSHGEERGGSGRSHLLRLQRAGPGQPQLHVRGDGEHRYGQGKSDISKSHVSPTNFNCSECSVIFSNFLLCDQFVIH